MSKARRLRPGHKLLLSQVQSGRGLGHTHWLVTLSFHPQTMACLLSPLGPARRGIQTPLTSSSRRWVKGKAGRAQARARQLTLLPFLPGSPPCR